MRPTLLTFVERYQSAIEKALADHLPVSRQPGTGQFNDALHYAVFPGGKRWRPILTLLGGMIVGIPGQQLLPAACAIEYLHTSSMIIDDLPAMDDADLRRGKATLHLAFDESTTLLVSLALMNRSYALLGETCCLLGNNAASGTLIARAAELIGSNGMIGGQVVDLELRGNSFGSEGLTSRNLKTTALMELMMTLGAIAVGAPNRAIDALASFGAALGTAYQICDDILDEVDDERTIGKSVKQDIRHRVPTYVYKYGISGAKLIAETMIQKGINELHSQFSEKVEVKLLTEAATMILTRKKILQLTACELVAAN